MQIQIWIKEENQIRIRNNTAGYGKKTAAGATGEKEWSPVQRGKFKEQGKYKAVNTNSMQMVTKI